MDAADQRHDVTTRVVISGTYTPNGFGSVATRNGGGISFYYFKEQCYQEWKLCGIW